MLVHTILKTKGGDVVGVRADDSIADVATVLKQHDIGAVIVRDGRRRMVGVLSERDIVRALAEIGGDCLKKRARDLMARDPITCDPGDSVEDVMGVMTERRVRHLPVMRDGKLIGLISIGDVVKSRISELDTERQAMQHYIASG